MGTYDTFSGHPRHDPLADYDPPCKVCGLAVGDCDCPECPICGVAGDPICYKEHNLKKEFKMRDKIIAEIISERERQIALAHGGNTDEFDRTNSANDWIAYICCYAGRAARKVFSNEKRGEEYRANLIKVAALVIAAIEAEDNGWTTF